MLVVTQRVHSGGCPLRGRFARTVPVAPARAGLCALVPAAFIRAGNVGGARSPSRVSTVHSTSPRWWHRKTATPSFRCPLAPRRPYTVPRSRACRRTAVERPSLSGTPWVPTALFDTHAVPLAVTVVEISAIGSRSERRLAEVSGGARWGCRREHGPRLLCSASIGAHGYGACLSRAWLQSKRRRGLKAPTEETAAERGQWHGERERKSGAGRGPGSGSAGK